MDEDDESKRFQAMKRWWLREEWEQQQVAAKKFKKDVTNSTSSPSPTGERLHTFTKQISVRNDFTKSTSSRSPNGEEIHAFTKPTLQANSQLTLAAKSQQTFEANSQQKGKEVGSIEIHALTKQTLAVNSQQKANSQQTIAANSQQKGKKVASIEEATRSPIFADVPANYRLTPLEKSHLSLQKKLREVHRLVYRLVSLSSTSRSDMLNTKEKYLFSETSSEEKRNLKSLFSQLKTADLVNLRIKDFLELLKTLEVQADGVKELESKLEVQNMIDLYQQHLIDDNRLLAFFQQLEDGK